MVQNFFWLQNHYFENRSKPKIFCRIFFYDCKIISSEPGLPPKLLWKIFRSKMFMVAKSLPRNQDWKKNFIKMFGRKFFMVARSLPRNQDWKKKNSSKFLVENFLSLKIHFLENRFRLNIFINCFCCKFLWF